MYQTGSELMHEPNWRPIAFSPDEWKALSLEEQIQWWNRCKENKRSPHRIEKLFKRGFISESDVFDYVVVNLAEDNFHEFKKGFSPDVWQLVTQTAQKFPGNDDENGWKHYIHRIVSCVYPPWLTPEEIEKEILYRDQRLRNCVRLIRLLESDISIKPN
ncbi:MAG: hypothetical protein QM811_03365 [Pirellulales bacterium]